MRGPAAIASVSAALALASLARAQDATEQPPPPPPTTTATVAPPPPAPVTTPPADAVASESPHARFRFDAKISSGLLGMIGFVPQIMPGVMFGRWSVGLGLGFLRGTLGASTVGSTGGSEASVTYLSFAPTVLFDVVRSSDDKVALYALASLAPSLVVLDNGASGGGCNGGAGFVLGYQAALGARYAMHKQFMLGIESGPTGQLSTSMGCSTPGSTNVNVGLHGLYGALVGTFVTP